MVVVAKGTQPAAAAAKATKVVVAAVKVQAALHPPGTSSCTRVPCCCLESLHFPHIDLPCLALDCRRIGRPRAFPAVTLD